MTAREFGMLFGLRTALFALCFTYAARASTAGPGHRFVPLVLDGGGWTTRISVTNLGAKPASILAGFMNEKGYADPWQVGLRVSSGSARRGVVEGAIAPGATMLIETTGAGAEPKWGFAEIVEVDDQPLGVSAEATLVSAGRVERTLNIPFSPGHERRSTMPVDLRDAGETVEFVFVSVTTSTVLDVVWRNLAGETVQKGQIDVSGAAQLRAAPLELWPNLAGFVGAMEWTVAFPQADRYEQRTLCGVLVRQGPDGSVRGVVRPLTLPADQASTSPY